MIRTLGCAAFAAWFAAVSPAWPQGAMLDPPDNRYFVSQGSWGQKYADQWGLHRVGFDSSPQSAWRLVKRDAKPVVVALIDTRSRLEPPQHRLGKHLAQSEGDCRQRRRR
jgi:hypothetical protein